MVIKSAVMIVEDVPEMRLLLEQLVGTMARFKVTSSCASAAEARLELTRHRPELVLLDEILPGESSADLLKEFLDEGIAVVLMTSMEHPTHELPAGVRMRIAKPGWKSMEEDRTRIESQLGSI